MDSKVISHVFGAVNSAERTLTKIEELLPTKGFAEVRSLLPQQKEIIRRMRRVANLLQLEAAKEDWTATVRSLRVFYGLHHMIRKDLINSHKSLKKESPVSSGEFQAPATQEVSEQILH